jgi:L-fuculose-phosphate aldolase
MRYEAITPADLVCVTPGAAFEGERQPSREWRLHAAVYAARPDVGAVVHTHSPRATAWSFLGEDLQPETEENEYFGIGSVRTARAAPAGSALLAANALAGLGDSRAVLLERHGVLAVGASVEDALDVAQAVEYQATIAWLLRGESGATRRQS